MPFNYWLVNRQTTCGVQDVHYATQLLPMDSRQYEWSISKPNRALREECKEKNEDIDDWEEAKMKRLELYDRYFQEVLNLDGH